MEVCDMFGLGQRTSSQTWNVILSDEERAVSQDDEEEVATSIRRKVNQYNLRKKRWDIIIKCDPLEYWKANKMV